MQNKVTCTYNFPDLHHWRWRSSNDFLCDRRCSWLQQSPFSESNIYIYCVLLCVITVNYYIFVGEAQTTLCASVTYGISELLRKVYISTSAICACQHFGKSQKKHGSAWLQMICSSTSHLVRFPNSLCCVFTRGAGNLTTSHPSLFVIVDHPIIVVPEHVLRLAWRRL